jgi:CheY-specific phosphatase CheX
MPGSEIALMIHSSASEVLETMFFTGVIGETKELPSDPISIRLDFRGDPSGSFGVCLSREASIRIASAFLAEDETVLSENQVEEVISELANMLCGSLLSRLEADSLFELTHPELAPPPDRPGFSSNFEIDGGILGVWLTLGETP